MPNGKELLNDMDFNKKLDEMGDDLPSLVKFMAWRQYDMTKQLAEVTSLCPVQNKRIQKLETRGKKEVGASGGVGAVIGVAIATLIEFFLRR